MHRQTRAGILQIMLKKRKKTKPIFIGNVGVGGSHPISVQSMTNVPTDNVEAVAAQICKFAAAGCEIVRVSVPDKQSAEALPSILEQSPLPIVADIHFDYRLALAAIDAGIHGLRINPGNIGSRKRAEAVAKAASQKSVPIRIGVNAGSLEKDLLQKFGGPTPEAMVESALGHVRILEDLDFNAIKISLKASDVISTVEAYRLMSKKCKYPLHLGITEAGTLFTGTIKSSVGLGILLADGIGDTIRVSLSADPVEEVRVGWEILKSLDMRERGVRVVACPTCARSNFDVSAAATEIERRLGDLLEPVKVAVMGCVVNGPGEARQVDVGAAGLKKGKVALYLKGKRVRTINEDDVVDIVEKEVRTLAGKN